MLEFLHSQHAFVAPLLASIALVVLARLIARASRPSAKMPAPPSSRPERLISSGALQAAADSYRGRE